MNRKRRINGETLYQIFLRPFTPEGTIAAAEKQLPEVADLGVKILYLCPVAVADDDMDQENWSPRQIASGCNNPRNPYRISDYTKIDPEYGTEDDMKSFIRTAHSLGMKVLLDLVYCHAGPSFLKDHPGFAKGLTEYRFPELDFLDFGGGFKVPYKPGEERVDYVKMGAEIKDLFQDFCRKYGKELELKFEPGKYIVAEAGVMLTTVNTLKFNRTRTIAGCDAGFPQLIRPVFYGAYHQIENLSNPSGEAKVYDVCGNICESGDRFAEQRELPEIREYDVLAIYNAGAYCYSMGGIYNLRSMPGEVVITNGQAALVRKRKSNCDLVAELLDESIKA